MVTTEINPSQIWYDVNSINKHKRLKINNHYIIAFAKPNLGQKYMLFPCLLFLLFFKKIQVNMYGEKRKKLLQICNFHIINDFEQFFTFFTMLT